MTMTVPAWAQTENDTQRLTKFVNPMFLDNEGARMDKH